MRASDPEADWKVWLIEGGRGSGKTRPASEWITAEAMAHPGIWVALISETVKDVRDVMIEHPKSGLLAVSPPWFKAQYFPSLARVEWPNGSFATIYSAETPEALRGPEFERAWADEFAKWEFGQREVLDNLRMCLRGVGRPGMPSPRAVFSTTPKPSPAYKELRQDRRTVRTGAPTATNRANLDADFVGDVYEKYAGTRLGRQELEAVLHEDVPGALWTLDIIDAVRVPSVPEGVGLLRVVVAVDPAVGASDPDAAAEVGIVVCGMGTDGHGYVLHDGSMKGKPGEWGNRACDLYKGWAADRIVAEVNNGGDLVEFVLRTVNRNVSYGTVWAARGKQTRAEPVASLYERGMVHHVGRNLATLEAQMTSWKPGEKSPDRMDALVWGITELMLGETQSGAPIAGGVRVRRSQPRQKSHAPVSTSGRRRGRMGAW